jgi:NAD(P)-dependent dehydrogenase (short-subunit alcohol dehydrogenase family)
LGTLAETAAHIHKSTGREVFHQALDVTDSAAVASFVAKTLADFEINNIAALLPVFCYNS